MTTKSFHDTDVKTNESQVMIGSCSNDTIKLQVCGNQVVDPDDINFYYLSHLKYSGSSIVNTDSLEGGNLANMSRKRVRDKSRSIEGLDSSEFLDDMRQTDSTQDQA